jgi:hypothetical protein
MLTRVVEQAWHAFGRLPCAFFLGLANEPFPKIINQVVIHVGFSWKHLKDVFTCYKDVCLIYQHLRQFKQRFDYMKGELWWYQQYRTQSAYLDYLHFSYLQSLDIFHRTFILNPFSTLLDTTLKRYLEAWVSLVDAWAKLDAALKEADATFAAEREQRFFLRLAAITSPATDESVDDDNVNSVLSSLETDGSSVDTDHYYDNRSIWPYSDFSPRLETDDDNDYNDDRENLPPLVTDTVPARVYRCTLRKESLPQRQR